MAASGRATSAGASPPDATGDGSGVARMFCGGRGGKNAELTCASSVWNGAKITRGVMKAGVEWYCVRSGDKSQRKTMSTCCGRISCTRRLFAQHHHGACSRRSLRSSVSGRGRRGTAGARRANASHHVSCASRCLSPWFLLMSRLPASRHRLRVRVALRRERRMTIRGAEKGLAHACLLAASYHNIKIMKNMFLYRAAGRRYRDIRQHVRGVCLAPCVAPAPRRQRSCAAASVGGCRKCPSLHAATLRAWRLLSRFCTRLICSQRLRFSSARRARRHWCARQRAWLPAKKTRHRYFMRRWRLSLFVDGTSGGGRDRLDGGRSRGEPPVRRLSDGNRWRRCGAWRIHDVDGGGMRVGCYRCWRSGWRMTDFFSAAASSPLPLSPLRGETKTVVSCLHHSHCLPPAHLSSFCTFCMRACSRLSARCCVCLAPLSRHGTLSPRVRVRTPPQLMATRLGDKYQDVKDGTTVFCAPSA